MSMLCCKMQMMYGSCKSAVFLRSMIESENTTGWFFSVQDVFISQNEVSWDMYPDLTDADWHLMLPGKVGLVCRIKQLLHSQVYEQEAQLSLRDRASALSVEIW